MRKGLYLKGIHEPISFCQGRISPDVKLSPHPSQTSKVGTLAEESVVQDCQGAAHFCEFLEVSYANKFIVLLDAKMSQIGSKAVQWNQ